MSLSKWNDKICNSSKSQTYLTGKCNTLYDQPNIFKSKLIGIWIILYIIMRFFAPLIVGFIRYQSFEFAFHYYLFPLSEYGFYVPAFYLNIITNVNLVTIDYILLIISIAWIIINIGFLFYFIGFYAIFNLFVIIIEIVFLFGIQNDPYPLQSTYLYLFAILKMILSIELILLIVYNKKKKN